MRGVNNKVAAYEENEEKVKYLHKLKRNQDLVGDFTGENLKNISMIKFKSRRGPGRAKSTVQTLLRRKTRGQGRRMSVSFKASAKRYTEERK